MSFFSDLFTNKAKSESTVTPYDENQLQDMLSRLETMGGTPMEMYPDQMYAGMTPEQTQALDMRRQFAGGMGQMTDPAMEAWQSSLTAPDVANNPNVQRMMDANKTSLQRNLSEMMPTIESNMLGVNERLGGTGEGVAKGIAARGTAEALANANAGTMMDAYGQGLGQQRYAMGAAPGMAQFGMMPADIMMGVGDVGRAEEQRGISEDVGRFNFAQQEPWTRMQNQANLFNPLSLPYASAETKSQTTPSAFSVGNEIAGTVASFFSPMGGGGGGGGTVGGSPSMGGGVPGGYAGALGGNYNMPAPNSFMNLYNQFPGMYS